MKKTLMAAAAALVFGAFGSAQAATLTGLFHVTAVNVQSVSSAQSRATLANMDQASSGAIGTAALTDTFTYDGALNFGTFDSSDATTIAQWLATGGGVVDGLDASLAQRQLSKPNINNGSATTTFFLFAAATRLGAGDFTVRHDDGVALFEDGAQIGGSIAPTVVITTLVNGFGGGDFGLLYVATNGDPSVLHVDAALAPVPLPASVALLAAALGGMGLMRRRKAVA